MSLEVVNTIASIGTLLVITATAIAALGQLRHSRGSNQIIALTECREVLESESFAAAMVFVQRKLPAIMEAPEVRARIAVRPIDEELRPIVVVGNFFESMGSFVKHDIIDEQIACDLWSGIVAQNWDALTPTLAILRRDAGPSLWENFEYLAAVSKQWLDKHPYGTYPKSAEHLPVEDRWLQADQDAGIYARQ